MTPLQERIQRQQHVVDKAKGMLEGQAKDLPHLMRRISVRFTLARAEANIARLRAQITLEGRV